jgi:hypothetical protein
MAERPLDLHGRPLGVLRLSLTARCNLACPYCCPDLEDPPDLLTLAGGTNNGATAVDETKMLVLQGNGGQQVNRLQLEDAIDWTSVTNLGGTSLQNTFGAAYGFEAGRSYTQYTNGTATLFVDQTLFVESL